MFSFLFSTANEDFELLNLPLTRRITRPSEEGTWGVELLAVVNTNVVCAYNLLTKPNNVDVFRNVKVRVASPFQHAIGNLHKRGTFRLNADDEGWRALTLLVFAG
jgi:hypothetical protein